MEKKGITTPTREGWRRERGEPQRGTDPTQLRAPSWYSQLSGCARRYFSSPVSSPSPSTEKFAFDWTTGAIKAERHKLPDEKEARGSASGNVVKGKKGGASRDKVSKPAAFDPTKEKPVGARHPTTFSGQTRAEAKPRFLRWTGKYLEWGFNVFVLAEPSHLHNAVSTAWVAMPPRCGRRGGSRQTGGIALWEKAKRRDVETRPGAYSRDVVSRLWKRVTRKVNSLSDSLVGSILLCQGICHCPLDEICEWLPCSTFSSTNAAMTKSALLAKVDKPRRTNSLASKVFKPRGFGIGFLLVRSTKKVYHAKVNTREELVQRIYNASNEMKANSRNN
ncbi:hypothetical protein K0M31_016034 [Melipona bicolor]|uniref:Uncharacterized protein n=1 Tax=Melipona bicolor TaxID=60889 RepID=A0AA40G6F3_9HYME|nr:hypothetical protein K0M31_016034 [Melipona bicolor]